MHYCVYCYWETNLCISYKNGGRYVVKFVNLYKFWFSYLSIWTRTRIWSSWGERGQNLHFGYIFLIFLRLSIRVCDILMLINQLIIYLGRHFPMLASKIQNPSTSRCLRHLEFKYQCWKGRAKKKKKSKAVHPLCLPW